MLKCLQTEQFLETERARKDIDVKEERLHYIRNQYERNSSVFNQVLQTKPL